MYVPKHFRLEEFLPEREFRRWGHQYGARLWELIDSRVVRTAEMLRERYGPAYLNTWWSPNLIDAYGRHEFRGWRPYDCKVGSELSQHKWGRAADMVFRDVFAEEIRRSLLQGGEDPIGDSGAPWFRFITCVEEGVSWLHFDVRNWNREANGIKVVRP